MEYGKVIGEGNTAVVYEYGEGKVLKLFHQGYPKEAVEKEFYNAKAINHMNFRKPHAYELIMDEKQVGIVYDRIEGKSLLNWVMESYDVQGCGTYMARLHKEMLKHTIHNVPSYKEFLEWGIKNAVSLPFDRQKEIFCMLEQLPDGDTFCHGDFHPGNIFLSSEKPIVIDFMNVCHGNFLYDVARTVYLIEFTPVPAEVKDRATILQLKQSLVAAYLLEMKITRESIQNYLTVISVARRGECPNEFL